MTKEEAIAKLREQGHEVTPEEAKALEALLATGELDDASLEKIVGGLDPRFKKLLIGAGILALGAGGTYGIYRGNKYLAGRKKAKEDQEKLTEKGKNMDKAFAGEGIEGTKTTVNPQTGSLNTIFPS